MKILITENQLEKIIDKFISNQFKGITAEGSGVILWRNQNKIIKLLSYDNNSQVKVSNDIVRDLKEVFNLKHNTAADFIMDWIDNHLKLNVTSITFFPPKNLEGA